MGVVEFGIECSGFGFVIFGSTGFGGGEDDDVGLGTLAEGLDNVLGVGRICGVCRLGRGGRGDKLFASRGVCGTFSGGVCDRIGMSDFLVAVGEEWVRVKGGLFTNTGIGS